MRQPDFEIAIDGTPLGPAFKARVTGLQTRDEAGIKSDRLSVTFADDGRIESPKRGVTLTLAMGYAGGHAGGGLVPQGSFIVDGMERSGPPPILTITARAADMQGAIKAAKTRSWHDTTLKEIGAAIAAEHSLEPAISEAAGAIAFAHLDQLGESDLQFLTRIARTHDLIIKPAGGRLVILEAGSGESASGAQIMPVAVPASDILGYRLTEEDRTASQGAAVAWYHDAGAAAPLSIKAGSGTPVHEVPGVFATHEAALAAAKARIGTATRRSSQLDLTLIGNAALYAGGQIELASPVSGIAAMLAGRWTLASVTQTMGGTRGFITKARAERVTGP